MSKIEWTDATWNPAVGCEACSPGCDNCYAATVASRQMQPAHQGLTIGRKWTGEVRLLPERLTEPLRWRKPRRVFVGSMTDLFHPDVPYRFVREVFNVMRSCPQHTFQVLTKRPQRMREFALERKLGFDPEHPPANVWLGTSIESNTYAWRAEHLRLTPAAVRFISAEPLLGPFDQLYLAKIDWLIVGGESGQGARPMHPDWVRDLRDRCEGTPTAFFFKQWGAHDEFGCRVGKGKAGRTLDGRTWDEFPEVAS